MQFWKFQTWKIGMHFSFNIPVTMQFQKFCRPAEMSKLPDLGSNSSLACRALPALAPAPPKCQNEKSFGSGSVVVKSKKSSGKLELWFTNLLKQFPNFINHNFVTTTKNKKHVYLTVTLDS